MTQTKILVTVKTMSKRLHHLPKDVKQTLVVAGVAFVILMGLTIVSYQYAKGRSGTVVLPGGITYLGPTPTQVPPPTSDKITIDPNVSWNTQKGKIYPYEFSYPSSLSLGVFPDDPHDAVTIFWGNTNAQENLLFRIEDLSKTPDMVQYIGKSKKAYAEIWWKQYNWKGVSSITQFTNSKGLKGYRAKYVDNNGDTPFDNIFFEVPGRPELVIWMASRLLPSTVFDKIIDSVTWK